MTDTFKFARNEGRTLLTEIESKEVLAAAGIPVMTARVASTVAEALEAAADIGYPVVLKVVSQDIPHKSDAGGVTLNIGSPDALQHAFRQMQGRLRSAAPSALVQGYSVQQMAKPGVEVIIGATTDPQFGPVLMFGLGGVFVEVLKDVAFRVAPLEVTDASEMLRDIRGFPILEGVRGQEAVDLDAIESLLLRVSEFMMSHPDVSELDLNPVIAYHHGVIAVDARIVLSDAGQVTS